MWMLVFVCLTPAGQICGGFSVGPFPRETQCEQLGYVMEQQAELPDGLRQKFICFHVEEAV